MTEFFRNANYAVHIVDYFHFTENYNAFYIKSPFAVFCISLIVNAEGYLAAFFQRVVSVSAFSAMEVYSAVLGIVKVIHRHTVGVSVSAVYGQDSSFFFREQLYAFIVR